MYVHTCLVVEALLALEAWTDLTGEQQATLFAAALLHDVAKPVCTTLLDGKITSPGHAKKGEYLARAIVADAGRSFAFTEEICKLVRFHGLPLWFWEKTDPRKAVIEASLLVNTERLALLAEADVRGRFCPDQQELLDRIDLFREFCQENQCYGKPRNFASDHSRFVYFQKQGSSPDYDAYDDTAFEVILMSGLPGSGKDTWIKNNAPHLPVVSLDALRRELHIAADDNQSRVIQEAKERAKGYLRARQPFVWNATNVTKRMRAQLIELFSGYKARVCIVYLDTPLARVLEQNKRRVEVVPERVVYELWNKRDVPDLTEAHRVVVA